MRGKTPVHPALKPTNTNLNSTMSQTKQLPEGIQFSDVYITDTVSQPARKGLIDSTQILKSDCHYLKLWSETEAISEQTSYDWQVEINNWQIDIEDKVRHNGGIPHGCIRDGNGKFLYLCEPIWVIGKGADYWFTVFNNTPETMAFTSLRDACMFVQGWKLKTHGPDSELS